MKILYFYQYFGTPKGGWSTRVYEMTKRWVEAGHDVCVITSPYDKSDIKGEGFISKQMVEGINVIVINFKQSNKHNFLHRLFTFTAFSLTSLFYTLFKKYDIVVASSGPITTGLPLLFAKYIKRKRGVFEVRDLWPEGAIQLGILKSKLLKKIAYWFEKKCYLGADSIVACSPGMAQSITNRYPSRNVIVIPNASDIELFGSKADTNFSLPDWAKGKKIVLYTGSLGLIDNCQEFVNLAAELQLRHLKDIIVVLIGEGAEKMSLIASAQSKKLSNIYFLDLMPKNEVAEWVKRAHVTTLTIKDIPMLHTCSPNKIFDSFAAGKPIIQTTQGWIKELIEREKCGITIPPNTTSAFTDAVQTICLDEKALLEFSDQAKYVAKTYFDRDLLAKKMLQELESLHQRP